MKRIHIGTLIFALAIPLIVGGVSAAISTGGMVTYVGTNMLAVTPPAWVFTVAWFIIYLLLGLSSYFICVSEATGGRKSFALIMYAIQLVMIFMWPIIFFNWHMYLLALIWLVIMCCVLILCICSFFRIRKLAAFLLIPYILWLIFAVYLSWGAYMMK